MIIYPAIDHTRAGCAPFRAINQMTVHDRSGSRSAADESAGSDPLHVVDLVAQRRALHTARCADCERNDLYPARHPHHGGHQRARAGASGDSGTKAQRTCLWRKQRAGLGGALGGADLGTARSLCAAGGTLSARSQLADRLILWHHHDCYRLSRTAPCNIGLPRKCSDGTVHHRIGRRIVPEDAQQGTELAGLSHKAYYTALSIWAAPSGGIMTRHYPAWMCGRKVVKGVGLATRNRRTDDVARHAKPAPRASVL